MQLKEKNIDILVNIANKTVLKYLYYKNSINHI